LRRQKVAISPYHNPLHGRAQVNLSKEMTSLKAVIAVLLAISLSGANTAAA
jgi:hypothetical protein